MRLAVLTPIGPGHKDLVADAMASVEAAWDLDHGPFEELEHHGTYDHDGQRGRSAIRNEMVLDAARAGFEWIFFLDADDLLLPQAFRNLQEALTRRPEADAIWGQIVEQTGKSAPLVRPGQEYPKTLRELVKADPFRSLQIGYFVRAEVQARHEFREDMDAGEDFAMYLDLWRAERCVKVDLPFFVNRRGLTSHGPRSATGGAWRRAVLSMLEFEEARLNREGA
jgi:hypothetical protein